MSKADYQAIYDVVARIPEGRVASYGRIARLAGLPRRARLVGMALRNTPDEIQLPWHRVVRADGRIAFAPGSSAFESQAQKLRDEGIAVTDGRVDMESAQWDQPLDSMLWGPGSLSEPAKTS